MNIERPAALLLRNHSSELHFFIANVNSLAGRAHPRLARRRRLPLLPRNILTPQAARRLATSLAIGCGPGGDEPSASLSGLTSSGASAMPVGPFRHSLCRLQLGGRRSYGGRRRLSPDSGRLAGPHESEAPRVHSDVVSLHGVHGHKQYDT
jgi:hypothetical protein